MAFKSARCPNCSGELSLDPAVKKGFCMHCGSEIIVEEAIEAMAIDGMASFGNLLELAHGSFNNMDYENAEKLYARCIELDPNNSHALLGKALSNGYINSKYNIPLDYEDSDLENLLAGKLKFIPVMKRAIEISPEDIREELKHTAAINLNEMALTIYNDASSMYILKQDSIAIEGSVDSHTIHETLFLHMLLFSLFYLELASEYKPNSRAILNNIIRICTLYENRKTASRGVFDTGGNGTKVALDNFQKEQKKGQKYFLKQAKLSGLIYDNYMLSDVVKRANDKMNNIPSNDDAQDEEIQVLSETTGDLDKSFCYIATAVYGDYNAPEVVVLRNYRDKTLSKTDIGKIFVKAYYKFSPPFAARLRNNKFLSSVARLILDFVVRKLK